MDMSIRSMLPEEQKYTYTQSTQIAAQTGCIGHLRADLGSGEAFFSSWEDHGGDEKTQAFKDELEGYSGRIVLRIPRSLHKQLKEAAAAEGVSLNQYALYKLAL